MKSGEAPVTVQVDVTPVNANNVTESGVFGVNISNMIDRNQTNINEAGSTDRIFNDERKFCAFSCFCAIGSVKSITVKRLES